MAPATETVFGQTFGVGCVVVFLINWLKSARWFPFLQREWKTAQRVWSVLLAAASAVGVHVIFKNQTLTITGLSLTAVAVAGWAWLKAFAMQEFIYQATKQAKAAADTSAPAQAVELAEPAPKPAPAAKPADHVTRSDVDEFTRKVRGRVSYGGAWLRDALLAGYHKINA